MKIPFLKQVNKIVAFLKGKPYNAEVTHPYYNEILEALNQGDEDKILSLLDKKVGVQETRID